jgi:hypothetical protein
MADVYRVAYYCGSKKDFASFWEALDWYAQAPMPRKLLNLDNCDGAPDATNETGLTESQREMVEMVDWPPDEPCEGLTDGDPGGCDPEPREYYDDDPKEMLL